MKKLFLFLVFAILSYNVFCQKVNKNNEKLVSSVTVYSNTGKIINKISYYYNKNNDMIKYIRESYKFKNYPQIVYKITYNDNKFYGERFYEGKLTNEKYYYDNIDNRITMMVCVSKNKSNTLFKNNIRFTYNTDNTLQSLLFTDSYREQGMSEYVTSAELKEYFFLKEGQIFRLFFRNRYYTDKYSDLSVMCHEFNVYNNTNINLLQFLDYSNSITFNECDELYTEWTNYKADYLPNKILNKNIVYKFDSNNNIIEIKIGKFKTIKLEYVY